MAELYRNWLRVGLRQKGKSGRGLADHMGLSPAAVSRMVSGERQIKASELPKIAAYLGTPPPGGIFPASKVRVIGVVAAGIWREEGAMTAPTEHEIPVINDNSEQEKYALQVADASISAFIQRGAFAICVPYFKERQELTDGDLVHVERRKGNLTETTIKKLAKTARGFELCSDAGPDGRPARPVPIGGETGDETAEIKGLVIGAYHPF
jgi:transcriptional regulator with XRE-family HTH domain